MALPSLAVRLAEAEEAYHALQLGRAVVSVTDMSGESIRYTTANASRLLIYINGLKAEIAGTSAPPRPLRPMFRL